jgi:hypothetical protein
MITIETSTRTVALASDDFVIDDAQLAAVAFLARYSGRTLDAYRHDLRGFFQWAADTKVVVLSATRPHIELYRSWMEQRGLAASTIDRRLSTVCGFYRFAHIDGRIGVEPRAVRAAAQGAAERGSWHGPLRARHVLVHRRTVRSGPCRTGGAARPERAPSLRSVRNEHRGPRLPARASHVGDPGQGQQARHHSARPSNGAHHRRAPSISS